MDYTKKTTFAAFVNINKGDKYWVDGHFEYGTDTPTIFRFNTKEEKAIAQEVAQSYLDNWGFTEVELVVLEVKSRHPIKLKKRTEEEIAEARKKLLAASEEYRKSNEENQEIQSTTDSSTILQKQDSSVMPPPKKRSRKTKEAVTISL